MKTRIISGAVGVAILIVILVLHNTVVFPLAIAALSAMAIFELVKATKCINCRIGTIFAMLYAILLPILHYFGNYSAESGIRILCIAGIFLEMVLLHKRVRYEQSIFIVAVMLLVSHSLTMLVEMNATTYGMGLVVLALASAWIADTGAYFAGTFLGKHKLCPEISPKKTVEGFFGGIVADIVVMLIFGLVYALITKSHCHFLWLGFGAICCAVISVLGDLAASIIKRQVDIKDYGNIMPGHGGVMDRFDSALFTIPTLTAIAALYPIFY